MLTIGCTFGERSGMVSRLNFGSCGLHEPELAWLFFTRHSSSAFNKLKSLRSAHWLQLSSSPAIYRPSQLSEMYFQGKANEQQRSSGSAAGLAHRSRNIFAHRLCRQKLSQIYLKNLN